MPDRLPAARTADDRRSGPPVRTAAARTTARSPITPITPTTPGLAEQQDGRFTLVALVPSGRLEGEQAAAVAAVADLARDLAGLDDGPAPVQVTPWRSVVVHDLELPAALAGRELLAAAGLVVGPGTD